MQDMSKWTREDALVHFLERAKKVFRDFRQLEIDVDYVNTHRFPGQYDEDLKQARYDTTIAAARVAQLEGQLAAERSKGVS